MDDDSRLEELREINKTLEDTIKTAKRVLALLEGAY